MEKKKTHKSVAEWKELVAEYQQPHLGRAIWQIVNTLGSVAVIWVTLYFTMGISWWLTIGLSAVAGLFLVRSFIIFHDCGHGSFFKSKKANNILGFISGMSVFTPYHHWRWEHAMHHAT
jgi:omega-6 fatty acid desaturase (delta-12 desaturase)